MMCAKMISTYFYFHFYVVLMLFMYRECGHFVNLRSSMVHKSGISTRYIASRSRGSGDVRMADLQVGDIIADVDGYSAVLLFSHRDTDIIYEKYVKIETEDGRSITMSSGHYIDIEEKRLAGELDCGDRIRIRGGGYSIVISVEEVVATGMYSPQTVSGKMLVDGIEVSTYTEALDPEAAHAALTPLRLISKARLQFLTLWWSNKVSNAFDCIHENGGVVFSSRRCFSPMHWTVPAPGMEPST